MYNQLHTRAIKHIRHLLSEADTKQLATCLVHSRLDYANSLLHNTSSHNLNTLQRIQNTLARMCVNSTSQNQSVNSKLASLHWLPIRQRINFKLACITHTALHEKQPSYLLLYLNKYTPARSLRSSTSNFLTAPRTRLHTTDKSFAVAAPDTWNNLTSTHRSTQSHEIFRRTLKTHLFSQAHH